MRAIIIATLLAIVVAVGVVEHPVQAVTITKGVVIDPTGSLARYVFDCIYEADNVSLVVEEEWFMLGGIKVYCDPTVELTVIIHGWNPDNKNKTGEPVVDFSTIAHQKGSFVIKFEGLVPDTEYTIYKNGEEWKIASTDDKGVLKFHDTVGSENRYVIVKAEEVAPPIIPPPEEQQFPWYWIALVAAAVAVVVVAIKIRS